MRLVAVPAALCFLTAVAAAQQDVGPTLGPSFSLLLMGGPGVGSTSCEDTFFGAVGFDAARSVARQSIRFQAAARAYVLGAGVAECAISPLPPPSDGTFIVEDRNPLAAHEFLTTDARIDVDLPAHISTVSVGAGVAWREGRDVPYFLAGWGVPALDGVKHRFGLQLDYQWLRFSNEQFQRTFQGGIMTAEQRLGTVQHWSNAVTVGVRWAFGL